jgi:hypothetical protein
LTPLLIVASIGSTFCRSRNLGHEVALGIA